jgi:glucose/arabinose dehydrogenase
MLKMTKPLYSMLLLVLGVSLLFFLPKTFASPPPNFQTTLLVGTGLDFPTGLGVAPDGRIFILEQSGQIKIYKNGQLLSRFFDELPAYANSDRGLLGIAFDPDFTSNHFVYFYYIDN